MKRHMLIITCLLLIFLNSCESGEETMIIKTYDFSPVDYVIVRPDLSSKQVTSAAIQLRKNITDIIGYDITLTTDWIKYTEDIPVMAKEILIGETNRTESESAQNDLKYDEFIVRYDEDSGRIVILGGSDPATVKGVEFFTEHFLNSDTNMLAIPENNEYKFEYNYKVDTISINGNDLSNYVIISDDNASAEILRKYIISISGINLRIDTINKSEYQHKIYIEPEDESQSTYTVTWADNDIIIDGGTYAVGFFMLDNLKYNHADVDINGDIDIIGEGTQQYQSQDFPVMDAINIYVAIDGDDTNDGSIENPLQTINTAKDMVRQLKSTSLSPITVNIRGGEYFIDEQLLFTAEDSGSAISPLTYRAYENETVIFNGGIRIDNERITAVTDKTIIDRVIDKEAGDKLMQLDYSDIEIAFPELMIAESSGTIADRTPEIYINGTALTQARYPNDIAGSAYLRTVTMESLGEDYKTAPFTFTYNDPENRAGNWSRETLDNLYVYGFLAYDWSDGVYKVAEIEPAAKQITTTGGSNYPPNKDTRFCFFNVLEEIDQPGESFIDRQNKKVYFYPTADMETAEVYISYIGDAMFAFQDISNLTLKNLEFVYTRSRAIDAARVDNFVIDGCTVAHTSYNAITIDGINSIIKDSHIYDTAKGGVTITGGSRSTLVSGNNIIENNRIHDNTRIFKTYQPAIGAYSTGLLIRNNELYNNPHELIAIGGNDVIIEYNEIYNGVLESADMGAIYFGRDPSVLGVEIRYNYFHDIGNTYGGIGQQSIFSDDGNIVPHIHHNIFYRGTTTTEMGGKTSNSFPIKAHGSQFGLIENNIIIDSPTAAMFQPWTTDHASMAQDTWWLWVYDATSHGHEIWTKITNTVNMFGDLYRGTYGDTNATPFWDVIDPDLYTTVRELYQNNDSVGLRELAKQYAPAYTNIFKNNVLIKVDYDNNGKPFVDNGTDINTYRAKNDILESGNSMFVKYGEDFKLTDEGLEQIRKTIPEFENIPTESIGLKDREN